MILSGTERGHAMPVCSAKAAVTRHAGDFHAAADAVAPRGNSGQQGPHAISRCPEVPSRLLCSGAAIQLWSGRFDDPAYGWFKQADAAFNARPDQQLRIDSEHARDRHAWAAMGRVPVMGVTRRRARRPQAPQQSMRLVQQQLTVRP